MGWLEEQSAEDVLPALHSRVELGHALHSRVQLGQAWSSRLVAERSTVVVEQTCFGWLITR